MSQLTQPFSSRDTILTLITPPLAAAPPPPAGAERLAAKRGAYSGVPFYAAVSATLGLQRLYDLALDFGTRCDGLRWSYSPFEQPPCRHVADDPVGLVVGRGLDDAHKRSISDRDTTGKFFLLSFQLHHVFEMRDGCSFEQRDRLFRRCERPRPDIALLSSRSSPPPTPADKQFNARSRPRPSVSAAVHCAAAAGVLGFAFNARDSVVGIRGHRSPVSRTAGVGAQETTQTFTMTSLSLGVCCRFYRLRGPCPTLPLYSR